MALGWGAFDKYDAVEVAFCLVVALAGRWPSTRSFWPAASE
jgi:hypothetical protein